MVNHPPRNSRTKARFDIRVDTLIKTNMLSLKPLCDLLHYGNEIM